MGIFSRLFNLVSTSDVDMGAVRRALEIVRNYRKHEKDASEAQRKEAEEALAFLRRNNRQEE